MPALSGKGWRLAACLVLLIRSLDALYPNRDRSTDGSIGDPDHASRESDHNPFEGWVHAIDIDEDLAPGLDLKAFAEALRLSRDPRIRYVIYEGRIFKSYKDPKTGAAAWTWLRYTGPSPHAGHLHLSCDRTATARDDLRPWPNPWEILDMTPEERTDLATIKAQVGGLAHLFGLPVNTAAGEMLDRIRATHALVAASKDPKAFAAAIAAELDGITDADIEAALAKVLSRIKVSV